MAKNKYKSKLLLALSIILAVSFIIYISLRNVFNWVTDIAPEFMGIIIFALILTYGFGKKAKLKSFIAFLSIILVSSIILYIYGITNDVQILKDLMPEFMGGTGIGLILSIIFNRKYIF